MQIINIRPYKDWNAVVRAYPTAVYVGRYNSGKKVLDSPLRNRSKIKVDDRDGGKSRLASIEDNRQILWRLICEEDREVLAALDLLTPESVLVCWCAPLPCHSQTIIRAWEWSKRKK